MTEYENAVRSHYSAVRDLTDQLITELRKVKEAVKTENSPVELQHLQREVHALRIRETLVERNSALTRVRNESLQPAPSREELGQLVPAREAPRLEHLLEHLLFRDMVAFREALSRLGLATPEEAGIDSKAVLLFDRLHSIAAELYNGNLRPILDFVEASIPKTERERRTLSRLVQKLVVDGIRRMPVTERPWAVKSLIKWIPEITLSELFVSDTTLSQTERSETLWRAFSICSEISVTAPNTLPPSSGRKRSRDYSEPVESHIILWADPAALQHNPPLLSDKDKPSSRKAIYGCVDHTTTELPRIASNDPSIYIPDSDDEVVVSNERKFAQSRAVLSNQHRRSRQATTSAYYPHQQSREFIIGQLASRRVHAQQESSERFHHVACQTEPPCHQAILRVPPRSRIETAISAGITVLPKLWQAAVVAKLAHAEWRSVSDSKYVAVEADVDANLHAHSFITCSVSHKPCGSLGNRPMALPCGHVVSETALAQIIQNTHRSKMLKCPVCPREFTSETTRPISL